MGHSWGAAPEVSGVLQQATELLVTGLRNEFGIVDDVHEEILEAVMTNTERPRKK